MKRSPLLTDSWFQVCLVTAIIAAGITGSNFLRSVRREAQVSDARVRATPHPGLATPSTVPVNPTASAAPVTTLSTAKEPMKPALTPKTLGQWIVDASGAADSDSKTIQPVLTSARSGDTVLVRTGVYRETIEIGTSQITLRGNTDSGKKTIIEGFGTHTIVMNGGKAILENISISQTGGGNFRALQLKNGARINLKHVEVSATASDAILADGNSFVEMESCSITSGGAGGGIIVQKSKAVIADCKIHDNTSGIMVNGGDAEIKWCEIFDNKERGLWLSGEGANGSLANSHVHGNHDGCLAQKGAKLDIVDSDISNGSLGIGAGANGAITGTNSKISKCVGGVEVSFKGTISLRKCQIFENSAFAVQANGTGSTVDLYEPDIHDNKTEALIVKEGGSLSVSDGKITENGAAALVTDANTKMELLGVQITQNKDGINAGDGATIHLQQVVLRHNGEVGISVISEGKETPTTITISLTKVNEHASGLMAENAILQIDSSDFTQNKTPYSFSAGVKVQGVGNTPPLPHGRKR